MILLPLVSPRIWCRTAVSSNPNQFVCSIVSSNNPLVTGKTWICLHYVGTTQIGCVVREHVHIHHLQPSTSNMILLQMSANQLSFRPCCLHWSQVTRHKTGSSTSDSNTFYDHVPNQQWPLNRWKGEYIHPSQIAVNSNWMYRITREGDRPHGSFSSASPSKTRD